MLRQSRLPAPPEHPQPEPWPSVRPRRSVGTATGPAGSRGTRPAERRSRPVAVRSSACRTGPGGSTTAGRRTPSRGCTLRVEPAWARRPHRPAVGPQLPGRHARAHQRGLAVAVTGTAQRVTGATPTAAADQNPPQDESWVARPAVPRQAGATSGPAARATMRHRLWPTQPFLGRPEVDARYRPTTAQTLGRGIAGRSLRGRRCAA